MENTIRSGTKFRLSKKIYSTDLLHNKVYVVGHLSKKRLLNMNDKFDYYDILDENGNFISKRPAYIVNSNLNTGKYVQWY